MISYAPPTNASDRIELISGEALIGVIVERTDTKVVLDHPLLGRLHVPAEHVALVNPGEAPTTDEAELTADEKVLAERAGLPDPELPVPNPAVAAPAAPPHAVTDAPQPSPPADEEPQPDSQTPPEAKPAPKKQPLASAMQQETTPPPEPRGGFFNTGLLNGWKTTLSLGLTGFTGVNDRIDFYGKLNTQKKDKRGSWKFHAEAFYAETPGGAARDEGRVESTKRWIDPETDWFVFLTGRYQYNRLRAWDERVSAYAGLGKTMVDHDGVELSAEVGLGGNYEFGTVNELTPEAVFGASAVAWKLTPRQTLRGSATVYPNLEFLGDFRAETQLEWQLKLDAQTDTRLRLGLRHQYESRDRSDDRHDLKYFAAVDFSF